MQNLSLEKQKIEIGKADRVGSIIAMNWGKEN